MTRGTKLIGAMGNSKLAWVTVISALALTAPSSAQQPRGEANPAGTQAVAFDDFDRSESLCSLRNQRLTGLHGALSLTPGGEGIGRLSLAANDWRGELGLAVHEGRPVVRVAAARPGASFAGWVDQPFLRLRRAVPMSSGVRLESLQGPGVFIEPAGEGVIRVRYEADWLPGVHEAEVRCENLRAGNSPDSASPRVRNIANGTHRLSSRPGGEGSQSVHIESPRRVDVLRTRGAWAKVRIRTVSISVTGWVAADSLGEAPERPNVNGLRSLMDNSTTTCDAVFLDVLHATENGTVTVRIGEVGAGESLELYPRISERPVSPSWLIGGEFVVQPGLRCVDSRARPRSFGLPGLPSLL